MIGKTIKINQLHNQLMTRFNQLLEQSMSGDNEIEVAMRYSVLSGGKRFRPLLVYASGIAFGVELAQLDHIALTVELIHCYSLIHDDLPAMDDDHLRRGKPTCHVQFDEATAILAGDALHALAIETLCQSSLKPTIILEIMQMIVIACGKKGMVLGQMLDLIAEKQPCNITALHRIHLNKTGKLISACVMAGAIASSSSADIVEHAQSIGEKLGLAFQIQDDILEVESNTHQLGKSANSDLCNNKSTYPRIIGLSESKKLLKQTYEEVLTGIHTLPTFETQLLEQLILSCQNRTH